MSDVVIWVIVGIVVVIAVAGLLMFARSRKRRQSGTIGLPDLGAVSGDSVDNEQFASDPRVSERKPSPTAGQPDQKAQ